MTDVSLDHYIKQEITLTLNWKEIRRMVNHTNGSKLPWFKIEDRVQHKSINTLYTVNAFPLNKVKHISLHYMDIIS